MCKLPVVQEDSILAVECPMFIKVLLDVQLITPNLNPLKLYQRNIDNFLPKNQIHPEITKILLDLKNKSSQI